MNFRCEYLYTNVLHPKTGAVIGKQFNGIGLKFINGAKVKDGLIISANPFSNCQTFALAAFDYLHSEIAAIYNENNNKVRDCTEEEITESIKNFIESTKNNDGPKKRQMMIDVDKYYEEFVEKYFKNIMIKAPYENSTGSNMIMYLIRLW